MKMNAQYIDGIKTGTDVFGVVNVRHIIYNFPWSTGIWKLIFVAKGWKIQALRKIHSHLLLFSNFRKGRSCSHTARQISLAHAVRSWAFSADLAKEIEQNGRTPLLGNIKNEGNLQSSIHLIKWCYHHAQNNYDIGLWKHSVKVKSNKSFNVFLFFFLQIPQQFQGLRFAETVLKLLLFECAFLTVFVTIENVARSSFVHNVSKREFCIKSKDLDMLSKVGLRLSGSFY